MRHQVTADDLRRVFFDFQLMYEGDDGHAEELASLFVDIILHKVANHYLAEMDDDEPDAPSKHFGELSVSQPRDEHGLVLSEKGERGLDQLLFSYYIGLHPFVQMFFGLDTLSQT